MPQIIFYIAVSLDGFIADAGGGVDWLPAGDGDGGGGDYGYADFYGGVAGLIMGRGTYDQVRQFGEWPYPGKPAYVFTGRTPDDDAPPAGVRFVRTSAVDFVRTVAHQYDGAGPLWLVGGANLAAQFRVAGLIDEYRVFVIPVILGRGIPLFAGDGDAGALPTPLRLADTQAYADGVVMLRYHPQRG